MLANLFAFDSFAKPDFVFAHVNVVPMDRERVLFDHTVLIKDGKVEAILAAADYSVPPAVPSVDGKHSLYLLPGLTDMHVHVYFEDDFKLYLANGITTVRNMRGNAKHLAWRTRLMQGHLIGPQMVTAGPVLTGPTGMDSHTKVSSYAEASTQVKAQKEAGYDFIKVYDPLPANAYRGVVETARRLRIPVTGHIPTEAGIDGVLHAHQASIEHAEQIAYHSTSGQYDFTTCTTLARKIKAAGAAVCPTVGTIYQYVLQAEKPSEIATWPEYIYAHPQVRQLWSGQAKNDSTENRLLLDWQRRMVQALATEKVLLLTGTDTFAYGFVPGFSLHRELAGLEDCGLSRYEVLRASTVNAGTFLKRKIGQIAPGYTADLVLSDGNPLADLSRLRRPQGVMARGRWFTRQELEAILGDIAKRYASGVSSSAS